MVRWLLSGQREGQTYASAEPKVNTMILQARAELLGAKREGYLMAEMAVRHHNTMPMYLWSI